MTLSNFVLEAGFSSNISSTDYANKVLLILENGETLTYNDINIKSAQFAEYLINICKVKVKKFFLILIKNYSINFYINFVFVCVFRKAIV